MSNPQDTAVAEAVSFVDKLNTIIIFPTIALLSSVAFLLFLWGCFEYFINASNEEGRRKGVKNITYGIIGLVVMVSAFAILSIFTATFGLDQQLDCASDPSASGCEDAFVIPEYTPPERNTGAGNGGGAGAGNGGGAGAGNGGS